MVEFMLGKREVILYGEESTWGTAATRTLHLGLNTKWTPTDEVEWLEVQGAGTDTLNLVHSSGRKLVGGTLTFNPYDWAWLVYAIGSTTNTGTGPTVHTFTAQKTLPSFTMERTINATTDRVRTYEGCKVKTCNIKWGKDGFVETTMEIIAKDVPNGTSATSVNPRSSRTPFQSRQVIFTLNNVAKAYCVGGNINIDCRLTDGKYAYYGTDSTLISEPESQQRRYSGEFMLHYLNDTEFDLWELIAAVSNTKLEFRKTASTDNCTITFTNFYIESATDPTNLEEANIVTIKWKADSISVVANDAYTDYHTGI